MLNRLVTRSGTCGQSPPHGLDLEGVEPLPLCLLFDPAGVGIVGTSATAGNADASPAVKHGGTVSPSG